MKEFYKVNVYSERANLDAYNTTIIVSKDLFFYVTELFTHKKIIHLITLPFAEVSHYLRFNNNLIS